MRARICIVTSGHLSTCPRMLKAADALAAAGYAVRVVSTCHVEWATRADAHVLAKRRAAWGSSIVGYDRGRALSTYLWSGIRSRAARRTARTLGPRRIPLFVVVRAYGRVHSELVRAALREPADLYYGGTNGALAAVAEVARRAGRPYGLDLEDLHGTELGDPFEAELAGRILRSVLPGARFLTAGSDAIAGAYRAEYGVTPVTINNTFPLPVRAPDSDSPRNGGLRLYWFGQTIGAGRGLEDVVEAVGRARVPVTLDVRGRPTPGFREKLEHLAAEAAPQLSIVHHDPADPDAMVDLARGHDVGLALEPALTRNYELALTNKALTYPLAGLAVAMTDTSGQRPLAQDLGDGALSVAPGDVDALARGLRRWAEDPEALKRAKAAAWDAAKRRWHWEHTLECGALLRAVESALS